MGYISCRSFILQPHVLKSYETLLYENSLLFSSYNLEILMSSIIFGLTVNWNMLNHISGAVTCNLFFLRLSVRPPAGHTPSGTPLPLAEVGLFLQPCVSGNEGKMTVEEEEEEEGGWICGQNIQKHTDQAQYYNYWQVEWITLVILDLSCHGHRALEQEQWKKVGCSAGSDCPLHHVEM